MTEQPWIYVAWFRDSLASPDDEDREWVAVIRILATSAEQARQWGDHLAVKRAAATGSDRFIWSEVHAPSDPRYRGKPDWTSTPLVPYGVEASNEHIGW